MVDLNAITPLALDIDPSLVGARTGVYVPDDDRFIVMQFTGLKDKNGKHELYAGDKIVVGHDRGVVAFEEYELAWGIELEDDGGFQTFCQFYTDEEMRNIEYLGNIHTEEKQ